MDGKLSIRIEIGIDDELVEQGTALTWESAEELLGKMQRHMKSREAQALNHDEP